MLTRLFTDLVGTDPLLQGLAGGVFIATLNTFGAMLVLVWPDPSERSLDAALGFAAGVMLSASYTSLILPGIEAGGVWPVLAGFALGVLALDRADQWVPHIHVVITGRNAGQETDTRIEEDTATGREPVDDADSRTASVLLFIVAITLHNMPEGLAVGVAFGSGPEQLGTAVSLMLAIGIQNIPEGLAVAVAAANAGFGSLSYATFAGVRAGLVEIPIAVAGAVAVGVAAPLLPYAMGFAAGAMLFVISDEILPETHARGNERIATLGTMLGAAVMLYLDVVLA